MDMTKEQTACEKTTHQTLRVEDGVGRVHGRLRLGGVTDEALGFGEGDVGGSGAVALIVRDDFDAVVLPHANAAVGRAKVDADGFSFCNGCHFDRFNVVVGPLCSDFVLWEGKRRREAFLKVESGLKIFKTPTTSAPVPAPDPPTQPRPQPSARPAPVDCGGYMMRSSLLSGHKRQFEESFYDCDDHLLSGNENVSSNFEELNNIITFLLKR